MAGEHESGHFALQSFIESPDEKVILFQRTHWMVPLISSIATAFIGIVILLIVIFLASKIPIKPSAFFATQLIVLAIFVLIITKIVVDWYFHFFFVSNKKILEVRYSPFFVHKTNGVLLEQVNITEIDEKKIGIIKDVFDYGEVTVTFDRPTHEDEFTLENIPHPERIAAKLREHFSVSTNNPSSQIWYIPKRREFHSRLKVI